MSITLPPLPHPVMSNVQLPEPDFVQVHKPAFYKDIPTRRDWWSATSMHTFAAAVSAADNAALRERVRVLEDALRGCLSLLECHETDLVNSEPQAMQDARAALEQTP